MICLHCGTRSVNQKVCGCIVNKHHDRPALKAEYVQYRKKFDHAVQRAKRTHWIQLQNELVGSLNSDPHTFWREIGKVGIAQSKVKKIPMEVVCDDGSVTSDTQIVLNKWKTDFSSLYNCPQDKGGNILPSDSPTTTPMEPYMNDSISIMEVRKAVAHAKKGKAYGTDGIPSEVLKNDVSIAFYPCFA